MAQAPKRHGSNGNRLKRPLRSGPTGTAPLSPACTQPSRAPGGGKRPPENPRRSNWALPAAAMLVALAGPCGTASAADPQVQGVWMIEDEVAIAVARCGGDSLCGRIVWLRTARDDAGGPKRDAMNPDAALRDRPLCGLTVLDGLLPVPGNPRKWDAGSFYDARSGLSYGLLATRRSADVLVARVYIGMPIFGKNQTLLRVPRASGEGWC